MPKISVLMAVYNAERWLPRAISSLQNQTLEDIEIICADDASTDSSLDLLHRMAEKDARVRVVPLRENGGIAKARNAALSYATGEYVCMLDADDELSSDALALAVERMESAEDIDAVLFELQLVDTNGGSKTYMMPPFEVMSGKEAFRKNLLGEGIHGLYLIRMEIQRKCPYDESCRFYSDENTTGMHYLSSRSVARCAGVYRYYQHPSSSTHRVSSQRFEILRAQEVQRQRIGGLASEQDIRLYENYRWMNLVDVCMFYFLHGKDLSKEARMAGRMAIRRSWHSIEHKDLKKETSNHFGYMPMISFPFFWAQEWAYFSLRSLIGRNKR